MSVYGRILGRGLPSSLARMLRIPTGQPTGEDENPSQMGSYQRGLHHLRLNQAGLAKRFLQRALDSDPNQYENRLALALAFEMLAQHHDAAAQLDIAVAGLGPSSPDFTRIAVAAGLAHERAGSCQLAAERYLAAIAVNPPPRFALDRLVAIHLAGGDLEKARSHLRTILAHYPADQPARACLAHLLLAAGDCEPARWEYQQALCLDPDTWELPLELSRKLQGMASNDEAIALLEMMIARGPEFPDLRMRLGNLYSLGGDDTAARREYRRALAIHPDYLDCHIALARHEMRHGRPGMAGEHLRAAIAINNQHVEVYVGLGLAQQSCGQPTQAAETFASAGRISQNSAVLMVQLGMLEMDFDEPARRATGELDAQWVEELIAHDEWMLQRHPCWHDLRIEQAMLHRLMARPQRAAPILWETIMNEPAASEAWLQLGLVLMDQRLPPLSSFRRALEREAKGAQVRYRLALVCCGQLEFDLAMEMMQIANPGEPDAQRRVCHAVEEMRLSGDAEQDATASGGIIWQQPPAFGSL